MSNTDWGIFAASRDGQYDPIFIERPSVELDRDGDTVDAHSISLLSLIGRLAFALGIVVLFWTMNSIV
jgi:hypothetical protein